MMQEINIDCFEVIQEGTTTSHRRVGFFSLEAVAQKVIKENRYRSFRPYREHIVIYDEYSEYRQTLVNEIRDRALAKLSREERDVLGV
jgi:hypothetical protein